MTHPLPQAGHSPGVWRHGDKVGCHRTVAPTSWPRTEVTGLHLSERTRNGARKCPGSWQRESSPVSGLKHVQCPPARDTLSMVVYGERGCLAFPTARGGGGPGEGERALVTQGKPRLQAPVPTLLLTKASHMPVAQRSASVFPTKTMGEIGLSVQA